VVASLLDAKQRPGFEQANRQAQERLRFVYSERREHPLLPYSEALANRVRIEWRAEDVPQPEFIGRRVVEPGLDTLARYIDWTFFFAAWELKGRYPKILDHPHHGEAARELFEHGQELLRKIVDQKLVTARGVYGFWPALGEDDDVVLYADEARDRELLRFNMLRQQGRQPEGRPNRSLADYVAPKGTGLPDHLGAFAVTAGLGADELVAEFERAHDDYNAIMVKALTDRLAEAFAEWLHERARRDWGYGKDEHLGNEDLIAERYRGIRPAFGYPACPDHTEKWKLFELLRAPEVGIRLTESCAMLPAASVSGIYLAHPEARYFTVGRLDRDQVESYAARKGMPVEEVERWLSPNLGYDPEA
jgi:5-methyltetrahydrofolate--homocysteine methyltransferase